MKLNLGIKSSLKKAFKFFGYELAHIESKIPIELSDFSRDLILDIYKRNLTMVSVERLISTALSCEFISKNNIQGAFVECGVWRGGNSILAKGIFDHFNDSRKVFLFDTFAGMTEPSEDDFEIKGELAMETYESSQKDDHNEWCYASLKDVQNNFEEKNLLDDNVLFIKGDVIETLNCANNLPDQIAILRLDTDWYESTKEELKILYPRLVNKGILMIDDYGHWGGAKKACDEYFKSQEEAQYLSFIDYTGRITIKNEISI